VRDDKPLEAVSKRLEASPVGSKRSAPTAADGEVSIVALLGAGAEVEMKLPGRYKVSPQIAGALKAVPGVIEVQAM
jgi:DNA polymerase-3 subunit alpha